VISAAAVMFQGTFGYPGDSLASCQWCDLDT